MASKRIHELLLVDSQPVVRHGLRQILADIPDFHVAGEAGNGLAALQASRQKRCDLIVLEIALPDRDGIELLRQLHAAQPGLRTLVFTTLPETQFAVRAIRAGASGYLGKHAEPAALVEALRTIAEGRKYVSPELAQALIAEVSGETGESRHAKLSNREFQTLRLLASGLTVSGVAEKLTLSVKTVSMYRARLLAKMGLKNNAELMRYALDHELVE